MKVLRERKPSLRSFLKRSLVLFSIFALSFAFMACGGSDTRYIEVEVPGPPVEVPVEVEREPPRVTSIQLHNPEIFTQDIAFQGRAPNLDGAVVTLHWSQGRPSEIVTIGAANRDQFFTVPVAPTFGFVYEAEGPSEPFAIRHRSSTDREAASNSFRFSIVVPLEQFIMAHSGENIWFADQAPDYAGISAMGRWTWETRAEANADIATSRRVANFLGTASDAGANHVWQDSASIPFEAGFPVLDFGNIASGGGTGVAGEIIARIGDVEARQAITRFYEVVDITIESTGPNFVLFDDQFQGREDIQGGQPEGDGGAAQVANFNFIRNTLLNLVAQNDVLFRVHYAPGPIDRSVVNPTPTRSRVITWAEFQANRRFRHYLDGPQADNGGLLPPAPFNPIQTFIGPGDFTRGNPNNQYNGLLHITNQENPTWGFTIEYVGRLITDDQHLSVRQLGVNAPVYQFTEFRANAVERRDGARNPLVLQPPAGGARTVPHPAELAVTAEQINQINNTWRVWGNYTRPGSSPRQREVTLSARSFVNPAPDAPNTVPLWTTRVMRYGSLENARPLPIFHRGQTLTAEETIQIDVRGSTGAVALASYTDMFSLTIPQRPQLVPPATATLLPRTEAAIQDANVNWLIDVFGNAYRFPAPANIHFESVTWRQRTHDGAGQANNATGRIGTGAVIAGNLPTTLHALSEGHIFADIVLSANSVSRFGGSLTDAITPSQPGGSTSLAELVQLTFDGSVVGAAGTAATLTDLLYHNPTSITIRVRFDMAP